MGEFTAEFPGDRMYVSNHMWALQTKGDLWRFGLTGYAVRLLQDVYFLEWTVEPPSAMKSRQLLGAIESKKAESDLYAPIAGVLVAINDAALADPSVVNADTYGEGWLFEMESREVAALLSPEGYQAHLIDAWEVAQRTIKGQANT
ncbi:Glycine cleavage system H protein [Novipirellula galeiformis]|uniref:Glycine cleavage system H protein n=2 Tax=Novipirellula galeiformis TaxID=2528004 RepID=A0A5C6CII0_9BACT|nr:glycine cleavage system protein H [Novipirellula galeiformis]TWU23006.1 Glycine cleavage system H protein [Novipirellula galeiformis]